MQWFKRLIGTPENELEHEDKVAPEAAAGEPGDELECPAQDQAEGVASRARGQVQEPPPGAPVPEEAQPHADTDAGPDMRSTQDGKARAQQLPAGVQAESVAAPAAGRSTRNGNGRPKKRKKKSRPALVESAAAQPAPAAGSEAVQAAARPLKASTKPSELSQVGTEAGDDAAGNGKVQRALKGRDSGRPRGRRAKERRQVKPRSTGPNADQEAGATAATVTSAPEASALGTAKGPQSGVQARRTEVNSAAVSATLAAVPPALEPKGSAQESSSSASPSPQTPPLQTGQERQQRQGVQLESAVPPSQGVLRVSLPPALPTRLQDPDPAVPALAVADLAVADPAVRVVDRLADEPGSQPQASSALWDENSETEGVGEWGLDDVFAQLEAGGLPPGLGEAESAMAAGDGGGQAELFRSMIVGHARPLRDFMLEVAMGPTTRHWLQIVPPAVQNLIKGAEAVDLLRLAEALRGFASALQWAADAPGQKVAGEQRERLLQAYQLLVDELPVAFDFRQEREVREPLLVHHLLRLVPGVFKVTIDKLYAAGLGSLDALCHSTTDDLVAIGRLDVDRAEGIVNRFQHYREQRAEEPATAELAYDLAQERLRQSLEDMTRAQQTFLRAEVSDDRARKRQARTRRRELSLEIAVVLVQLGELELVESLERSSTESKMEQVRRYIERIDTSARVSSSGLA